MTCFPLLIAEDWKNIASSAITNLPCYVKKKKKKIILAT